jgi:hypothetical protein
MFGRINSYSGGNASHNTNGSKLRLEDIRNKVSIYGLYIENGISPWKVAQTEPKNRHPVCWMAMNLVLNKWAIFQILTSLTWAKSFLIH